MVYLRMYAKEAEDRVRGWLSLSHLGLSDADMPAIPESCKYLNISHNRLTKIPKLPAGLVSLVCSHNKLTSLCLSETSIEDLNCSDNSALAVLELPTSLRQLECRYCNLESLFVPSNCTIVNCSYNGLRHLDVQDSHWLHMLNCSHNLLKTLRIGDWPALWNFNCSYNMLKRLDSLHHSSHLSYLNIADNEFVELPAGLSDNLRLLDCTSNYIEEFPVHAPMGLSNLQCNGNPLEKLFEVMPAGKMTCFNCVGTALPMRELLEVDDTYFRRLVAYSVEIGRQRVMGRTLEWKKELLACTTHSF